MEVAIRSSLRKSAFIVPIFGLGFISYVSLKRLLLKTKYRELSGPKTKGLLGFFIGHILDLSETLKNGKFFQQKIHEWTQIYGRIFKIQFMDKNVIIMNDPVAIKELLVDNNLPKLKLIYDIMANPISIRFLGEGLVTQQDVELWRKQRALYNPGFHRNVLIDCLKEFNTKADMLMEKLRKQADGKKLVYLGREMNYVALDVIASVAFGISIDSINDPSNKLFTNIQKSMEIVNLAMADPFLKYNPKKRKIVNEFKDIVKYLRSYAKNIIVERLEKMKNNEHIPNDILSAIINNTDEELEFEQFIDQFITFFIAGQETTANTLAFCFKELGENPETLEKLKEEVDRVLGAKTEIKHEDIVALEYTGCVFKEALRKWPAVPQIGRELDKDMTVKGYHLPKGTLIEISSYVLGRDPEFFPNPDKFDPERFLNKSDSKISSYNYFPFSIGPRNCIGQNFAQIEGKLILAKFIQNFNFRLDPTQSNRIKEALTISPEDGVPVYLTIRN